MSDFVTLEMTEEATAPDPNKHVRYTFGMVLGKDDVEQEFAFHNGRDLWGMREVIGYGTVRGLDVKVEDDGANGPRVSVMPGVALTPRGELVCIPTEQCASLNEWLRKQARDPVKRTLLEARIASNQVRLYVTLCYRECPTDNVPIPGEPCRDEADAMAPSRLADDFALELRLDPPDQLEEESVRAFVTWLRSIPLDPGAADTPEAISAFAIAVRDAFTADVTTMPPEVAFNPPAATLRIPSSNTKEFYRTAFRVWVTDIRPRQDGLGQYISAIRTALSHTTPDDTRAVLPTAERPAEVEFINAIKRAAGLSRDHTTPGLMDVHEFDGLLFSAKPSSLPLYWQDAWSIWGEVLERWMGRSALCAWPPEEGCVLLAQVDAPLTAADANNVRTVNGNAVDVPVRAGVRPYVAHLRMLQEWLWSDVNLPGGAPPPIVLAGDVIDAPGANKVVRIQNTPVSPTAPTANQVLQFDGTNWAPAALPAGGGIPSEFTLAGDVTGDMGANQLARIQGKTVNAPTPTANQVLQFNGTAWVAATLLPPPSPPPVTLDGDVTGSPGINQIAKLQGRALDATAPTANQVLQFDGTHWIAAALPSSTGADAVQKPPGLPSYQIVAAGIVDGNGGSRPPVFNNLKMAASTATGVAVLTFDGYVIPTAADPSFQYIVKALGVSKAPANLTVVFVEYIKRGIRVGVTLNGEPVDVKTVELMVEISRFSS